MYGTMDISDSSAVQFITDAAVPLNLVPAGFRHPLARQFEEIDDDGELCRSYDEWGLASVLTYAYTRRVQTSSEYTSMEMVIGECLEQSRHTESENKKLFSAIKRSIKSGDEDQTLLYSKVLISKIGSALAEQHPISENSDEED